MAVVSVTTDLSSGLVDDASNVATWQEITGTGGTTGHNYADMKSIQDEADVYIQGTASVSGGYTTNGPERGSIITDNGSGISLPTDGAILVWQWWISPAALSTYANGGMFVAIGDTATTHEIFSVGGSDLDPSPLGGWYCYAVDPRAATLFENIGSPDSTTFRWIGGGIAATQQSRGLTHYAIDAVRWGRCQALVVGGTGADADATFKSVSDVLQPTSVSYGIFDSISGAYYMQGLLQLGDNTSGTGECDFTDANRIVNIRNTPQVGANFNKIEIQNGSTTASNISWTGCSFNNIGTNNTVAASASRGDLVVTDTTANVDITGCTFSDMGTFDFGSGTTLLDSTFARCETVTQGSAVIDGCSFDDSFSAVALSSNVAGDVDNCTFTGDGTTTPGHAIEYTGSLTTQTITWNHTLVNTGNQSVWEGSTTAGRTGPDAANNNAAVKMNIASGNTVTLSVESGTIPTVYNTGSGTLVISANEYTLTVTVKDITDDSVIQGAMVYVTAAAGGPLTEGTVIINKATTNVSGQVTDTRSLASDQPITGRVRSATTGTFYKTGKISGTFSSTANTPLTVLMIPDE